MTYIHPFCAVPSFTSFLHHIGNSILLFAKNLCPINAANQKEATFLSVIRNYDELISRLCLGYSRSTEEYEDLRQDAYINIWQSLNKFEGRAQLKTYLYRIVLNTCVSNMRRRSRETLSESSVDISKIVDGDAEHLQLLAEMYDMISRLPVLDKAILMMWLDEMSYEDISSVTGLPRNSVATRLRRAKLKLIASP